MPAGYASVGDASADSSFRSAETAEGLTTITSIGGGYLATFYYHFHS
ncbi:hypothetical protein M2310_002508 [Rhizobium leguminosarum]|uniref:Uncharacterized protein n=1 Tax=Rhizobium esperanzae TaxID=1967781 RepID=A0A7W6XVB0_9HYPH|nr:hypothetical protein [Rhizobium esperanzae]MDH6201832.1 hypothetical protein [Rhizobium leguminosarum]